MCFTELGWRFFSQTGVEPTVTGLLPLCPLFPLASRDHCDHLKQLLDSSLVLVHELSRPHLVIFDGSTLLHSRILFTDRRGIVGNETIKLVFTKTLRIRML